MGNPVYVHYDGNRYAINGRPMEDIQREIGEAVAAGAPYWLDVYYGEGRPSVARILIGPGIPVAVQQDGDGTSGAEGGGA